MTNIFLVQCEYVLRLGQVLFMTSVFLLLQACQQGKAGVMNDTKHLEAASYNVQLGLAYLKEGNRPLAKRKLLLALTEAPNSPDAHAAMAYFMEQTGNMAKAQWHYRNAIALAPHSGASLNNYGVFLCKKGLYKIAEDYFIKAAHDIEYEHTASAYENAGLCAMTIPDDAKAKRYFNKALKADPTQKQSLYELVNIELKQKRTNDALMTLEKYPALTMQDKTLLTLAVMVAQKAGKVDLEAHYKRHL